MPNYSGLWSLSEQMRAIAVETWTGLPQYSLWSWGNGSFGALGTGTANTSSPTQIGSATTWLNITAGEGHSAATQL